MLVHVLQQVCHPENSASDVSPFGWSSQNEMNILNAQTQDKWFGY